MKHFKNSNKVTLTLFIGLFIFLKVFLNVGKTASTQVRDLVQQSHVQAEQSKQAVRDILGSLSESPKGSSDSFFGFITNGNKSQDSSDTKGVTPQIIKMKNPKNLVMGETCKTSTCKAKTLSFPQSRQITQQGPIRLRSQILVFVTLSMSDASLKAYDSDVRRVGGRLVIRGLVKDSFKQTQQRLMALGIDVDINPPLFETFNVQKVPTIIHAQVKKGELDSSHPFDVIRGHISLKYALEAFVKNGEVVGATQLLKQLRGDQT